MSSKFYHRILNYTLWIFLGLGFLLDKISSTNFNMDEYQHTYLAWATNNFDMVQYRDFWDNHGILYTLFNSLILKIFQPEIGVPTLILERYANLALLVIGFYVLFEIFYEISSKINYAGLGFLFFSFSFISIKAIEVRPDNLQCLFLYLALITLFKALKLRKNKLAFIAGLFITLMLMTNLKSVSALMGIGFGLLMAFAYERSKSLAGLILWLVIGLVSGLLLFTFGFLSWGILDDYIKWNVIFNLDYTRLGFWPASTRELIIYFTKKYLFLNLCTLISFLICLIFTLKNLKKQRYEFLVICSIITYCLISRSIYLFWTQFDLLYLPLAYCILSYLIFLGFTIKFNQKIKKIIGLVLIIGFSYLVTSSYLRYIKNSNKTIDYFNMVQKRFTDINKFLRPGEYTDYYVSGNCPGFGFNPNLSHLLHKFSQTIFLVEKIEKKEIYSASYIKNLNDKKVRLLIGTPDGVSSTQYVEVRNYIFKNYKYYNCIWERITPFDD
jgi:Dolichyl-phosphate-mannose-protein mannosyltransferase